MQTNKFVRNVFSQDILINLMIRFYGDGRIIQQHTYTFIVHEITEHILKIFYHTRSVRR